MQTTGVKAINDSYFEEEKKNWNKLYWKKIAIHWQRSFLNRFVS